MKNLMKSAMTSSVLALSHFWVHLTLRFNACNVQLCCAFCKNIPTKHYLISNLVLFAGWNRTALQHNATRMHRFCMFRTSLALVSQKKPFLDSHWSRRSRVDIQSFWIYQTTRTMAPGTLWTRPWRCTWYQRRPLSCPRITATEHNWRRRRSTQWWPTTIRNLQWRQLVHNSACRL